MADELETGQEQTAESAETIETTEQAEETDTSESTSEEGAEPTEPKAESKMVPITRFNEVYAKGKQAERDAEYWRNEAQKKEPATPPQVQPTGEPQEEQYEDYNDYVKALTDWKFEQNQAQTRKAEEKQQAQERLNKFNSNLDKGAAKHEDFEIIYDSGHLPITPELRNIIVDALHDSDHAADILYHLATNPEQAHAVLSLPPISLARELGKLESKFAGPNPPAQKSKTNAPGPTSPVGGDETPPKKLEDMGIQEFIEHRNKQEFGA
jgi:hypothetical protein